MKLFIQTDKDGDTYVYRVPEKQVRKTIDNLVRQQYVQLHQKDLDNECWIQCYGKSFIVTGWKDLVLKKG